MSGVPSIRISPQNNAPVRDSGKYVLYWMIAFRRLTWNFAFDRAVEWARELKKPLIVFEALGCDYPWASDRLHRFVMEGMAEKDNSARGVSYYPYVEPSASCGKGLLAALAAHSCVVVTDDFPCFFLPRMVNRAAQKLSVRLEAIDSNGLLPLRAAPDVFSTAFSFRRFLQKTLPFYLGEQSFPRPSHRLDSLRLNHLPVEITRKWPATCVEELKDHHFLSRIPIDHSVGPVSFRGGEGAARGVLKRFLERGLDSYLEERNEPEKEVTSGLSSHLHFGHISVHEIFKKIVERERWSTEKASVRPDGKRVGWWGLNRNVEAFFDQLITWRELGFNFSSHRRDYDQYESLPEWSRKTLAKHLRDERVPSYNLAEFASAKTHDELWNAAQRQLIGEGRLHNYLRMLWGKKILEWSRTPHKALKIMIELNNRYAVDGRDPNSYSGIFWCLGRYDRPWGPERPIFGTVRYMSSQNTARKVNVKNYIRIHGA